jgi:hypothetical protein
LTFEINGGNGFSITSSQKASPVNLSTMSNKSFHRTSVVSVSDNCVNFWILSLGQCYRAEFLPCSHWALQIWTSLGSEL